MVKEEVKGPLRGFVLIKGKIKSKQPICDARVEVEYDSEKEVKILPVSASGLINYIIYLKKPARRLEVVIANGTAKVLEPIRVKRITLPEAFARFYRRVLPLLFSRNPLTRSLKKRAGLSAFDLILRPRYSYQIVSLTRHKRLCLSRNYQNWLEEYIKREENYLKRTNPSKEGISFLVVVIKKSPNLKFLPWTIESLTSQHYKNFRVKVTSHRQLKHILKDSTEDYVIFLEEGDFLSPSALYCFAQKAFTERPHILYADNDFIKPDGTRLSPFFKPDWSPDYFTEFDFIQMPVVFRRDLLSMEETFFSNFQLLASLLSSSEKLSITHVPALLGTKLQVPPPVPPQKKPALEKFLKGKAKVEEGPKPGTFRVLYPLSREPLVSIIIPTKDRPELIERCINSLREKTSYRNYELIIVDNGSTDPEVRRFYEELSKERNVKILYKNIPFNFPRLVNYGVKNASGEHICLLNNDTEVINEEWLTEMVRHGLRKEIGVVGAKLLYPDGRVQHGGVVLGIWHGPEHAFKNFPKEAPGYMNRLITLQNYLAVTAACMLFRKEVFNEVGGFDERFAVNFNDTDFCLRVYEKGYRILWTPHALLYHMESKSRKNLAQNGDKELALFRRRWRKYLLRDPYYNPNLSPYRTDFSLSNEVEFHCSE